MGILIAPLFGFLLSFFARYLGKASMGFFLIGSVATSFIFALNMFYTVCIKGITCIYTFDWMIINNLELKFTFLFDPLTMIMTLLITFITTLVMIYSYSYLNEDPSLIRFLAYMSFFCLTMLTMVTSGNYIQFFVGWEGVGLASYLLISFWMTRNEANQGGLKAVIVNRVGDVFFMFALGLMWVLFKSFDFNVIFNIFPMVTDEHLGIALINKNISLVSLLACCLLIAACAKSAQIFLHTWLPDAMEGPTPVSALLHSATMVTAGVFLIIRSSFIFEFTPNLSYVMASLGIITALVSGLIGVNQYDLKKIIAYSTCSQLGYMFFTVGLGYYNYALFHLVTHAFFKCLLFLCSGAIIHAIGDEQDIRKMGKLYGFMPITFSAMLMGTLALTGFPMLSGFYSKDLILEVAFSSSSFGFFIFCVATIAAFWTAFYSMRSLYYVFFTPMSSLVKSNMPKIEDAPLLMVIPMIMLTFLSIISGYFLEGFFVGPNGLVFLRNSMGTPLLSSLTEFEYSGALLKGIPTLAGFLGIFSGLVIFYTSADYKAFLRFYLLFNLTNQKFYFDHIYNLTLAKFVVFFGYLQYKLLDRGLLELLGPNGLSRLVAYLAKKVKIVHNGYLLHYLLLNFSFIIMWMVEDFFVFEEYNLMLGIFAYPAKYLKLDKIFKKVKRGYLKMLYASPLIILTIMILAPTTTLQPTPDVVNFFLRSSLVFTIVFMLVKTVFSAHYGNTFITRIIDKLKSIYIDKFVGNPLLNNIANFALNFTNAFYDSKYYKTIRAIIISSSFLVGVSIAIRLYFYISPDAFVHEKPYILMLLGLNITFRAIIVLGKLIHILLVSGLWKQLYEGGRTRVRPSNFGGGFYSGNHPNAPHQFHTNQQNSSNNSGQHHYSDYNDRQRRNDTFWNRTAAGAAVVGAVFTTATFITNTNEQATIRDMKQQTEYLKDRLSHEKRDRQTDHDVHNADMKNMQKQYEEQIKGIEEQYKEQFKQFTQQVKAEMEELKKQKNSESAIFNWFRNQNKEK